MSLNSINTAKVLSSIQLCTRGLETYGREFKAKLCSRGGERVTYRNAEASSNWMIYRKVMLITENRAYIWFKTDVSLNILPHCTTKLMES